MTKGFGTSTGNTKPDKGQLEHQARQLSWTKFIAERILPYKQHRKMLTSGPKNTIPVFFYPSKQQLRSKATTETVHFPFGWNKDGKYPENYLPIVTFSIPEHQFCKGGSEKVMTHWALHLYDTARNILISAYEVRDSVHIGALNMDELTEAPVPDDYHQFRDDFIEGFLIWMTDQRTVAA